MPERLAEGVELPSWATASFSSAELAVLGAIRDAAYKTVDSTCSLSMEEIARLIDVHPRTVARAITVAIAAGVLERDGATIINRGVSYKIG
jgi:DNA-binding MarR family transcriptional regulator